MLRFVLIAHIMIWPAWRRALTGKAINSQAAIK